MREKRKVSAFAVQVVSRVAAAGFSFVTVTLSARYFGPADYGVIVTALGITALFAAFGDTGINTVTTRRLAQNPGRHDNSLMLSFTLTSLYSVFLAALAAGTAIVLYGESGVAELVVLLFPFIVLQCSGSGLTPVFQVHNRFGSYALSEVSAAIVTLATITVVIGINGSATAYAVAANLAALARFLILTTGATKLVRFRPQVDSAYWRLLVRESLPVGASSAIGVVYARLDIIILSLLAPTTQVGLFGVAYRIVAVLAMLPGLLVTSAFFGLAQAASQPSVMRARSTAMMTTLLRIFLPVCMLGAVAAPQIVLIVGGSAFEDSALPLRLLFLAILFKAVNTVQGSILTSQHKQQAVLAMGLSSLAIMTALLVVLVPGRGAAGAALALVVAELLPLCYMTVRLSTAISWSAVARGSVSWALLAAPAACAYLAVVHSSTAFWAVGVAVSVYTAVCAVHYKRKAHLGKLTQHAREE
ncbi:oligosaccharide flippase family protein [Rhodococcoides kroppenstedtii]|uniref:oligosaccharide flippase family protein n=1 Tax=Rhodococcoides kroppenstedtii TaxID=293050 RepID=UPI003630B712